MTVTENAPAAGVDPVRWPDVATVPHSPLRAVAARRIFRRAAARLPLRVVESGGPSYGGGDTADPTMRLVRPTSFFHRLGATGTIGFGEAYMAGDWTTEDLPGVLSTFAAHVRELVPAALQGCAVWRCAASRRTTTTPSKVPGATSSGITTCRMTCSRCSSTSR